MKYGMFTGMTLGTRSHDTHHGHYHDDAVLVNILLGNLMYSILRWEVILNIFSLYVFGLTIGEDTYRLDCS